MMPFRFVVGLSSSPLIAMWSAVVVLHILGKLTWRLVKALSSSHTLGVPIKESSIITDVVIGDHRGTPHS
jgi:hypothetical protein